MREIVEQLAGYWTGGGRAAVATVVQTLHSAPRPAGSAMALTEAGDVVGSVSGGCVESSVLELAEQVLHDGRARMTTFGLGSGGGLDELFAPSLTCGGVLDVAVRLVDTTTLPGLPVLTEALAARRPVTLATAVAGPGAGAHAVLADGRVHAAAGAPFDDRRTRSQLHGLHRAGRRGLVETCDGSLYTECFLPPPRMVVVGAGEHAAAVSRIGAFLGFHVTVCDARAVFATAARFPHAHEVVVDQPHRVLARTPLDTRAAVCVLTHDPRTDVPALQAALGTPAGYIGAMGSRRTHTDRVRRLAAAGVSEPDIARLHSPIGLDLGGHSPEETAVAIAAEIVALRHRGSGVPLRDSERAIHH